MNNNLTWLNGWSVKNIDTAIYWRLKRIRQLDIDKIINTRKTPNSLINAIE
jgi:hypothetical protein